jgi:hypothetical protein
MVTITCSIDTKPPLVSDAVTVGKALRLWKDIEIEVTKKSDLLYLVKPKRLFGERILQPLDQ